MDREQLAWLAGVIDGEGGTYWGSSVFLKIGQGDDVDGEPCELLRRVDAASPVRGKFYQHRGKSGRGHHIWQVNGFEKTQAVIAAVWPWLGPVKREQAVRALTNFRLHGRVRYGREKLNAASIP